MSNFLLTIKYILYKLILKHDKSTHVFNLYYGCRVLYVFVVNISKSLTLDVVRHCSTISYRNNKTNKKARNKKKVYLKTNSTLD